MSIILITGSALSSPSCKISVRFPAAVFWYVFGGSAISPAFLFFPPELSATGVVAPREGCERVAGVGAVLGAFEAAHEEGFEVVGGSEDLGG